MGYTHGRKWTDEAVKEDVMEVVNFFGLKRMPSRVELNDFYGNSALTNRIMKTGGLYKLAKELGLPMKESNTNYGKQYEYEAKRMLEDKGYKVEKMSQNFPYDLLLNNNVKIDVKVSRIYETKEGYKFYSYRIGHRHSKCDIYMFIAINGDKEKIYIIPSKEIFNNLQVSIGINSKYEKFVDRYDYIDKYLDFYEKL